MDVSDVVEQVAELPFRAGRHLEVKVEHVCRSGEQPALLVEGIYESGDLHLSSIAVSPVDPSSDDTRQ